jgi:hypothetical protein
MDRETETALRPPSELIVPTDDADVGVTGVSGTGAIPDGARPLGGTSCTCKFNGWFDFDGGGRTKMSV